MAASTSASPPVRIIGYLFANDDIEYMVGARGPDKHLTTVDTEIPRLLRSAVFRSFVLGTNLPPGVIAYDDDDTGVPVSHLNWYRSPRGKDGWGCLRLQSPEGAIYRFDGHRWVLGAAGTDLRYQFALLNVRPLHGHEQYGKGNGMLWTGVHIIGEGVPAYEHLDYKIRRSDIRDGVLAPP